MTSQEFRTLAYTKSPKTSKRTTFQDELKAAVSARASKEKTDRYSYYNDFDDDEDDFLNELLKSRKQRTDAFKAGKSKAKINDFELSDDEGKQSTGRTKRVSFLKTQQSSSNSNGTTASESHKNVLAGSPIAGSSTNDSFTSQNTTNVSENNEHFRVSSAERTRENSSLSYQTSDDTLLDMPLPLPSDSSVGDTPGPEDKGSSDVVESSQTPHLPATDLNDTTAEGGATEPPKPKPRQRILGLSLHNIEKRPAEEDEVQDVSRPQTSSASAPLSADTSSHIAWTDTDLAASCSISKSSSNKSELSELVTTPTVDSGSRDGIISDNSKDQEKNYSTSFEEFNEHSVDHSDQLSHAPEKSTDTRTSSSLSKTPQRPQSACSRKVESKYLGTLKVLDRKVSLEESQPQAGDSLRAAIYQEWLKKKKEKSRENLKLKKKEDILKENKKKEEEAKKEAAIASYEAWKEKKVESLRAKAKQQQDTIRKEQRVTEEKEEKRLSAKKEFEKWKEGHDHLLKEKYRKQKEAENRQRLKKQEQDEERKRDSRSAFSDWCEKKKDVLHEKHTMECKLLKNKDEEDQYMKEERDKMALEMYENWLMRKDLEQKRQKEERRIQAILGDSPPPPWSPPNKTIPYRK
ncbi:microtubule-associated protein 9 [Parambassis ranga]|uniref:Microtubule-associated protein 9 n=1 Tax=Parambassis ranga TaxID=210632 RepID=A0A6P7IG95_9TELE|nr:microtubule-associated protein 9 [Parambassis ranga]